MVRRWALETCTLQCVQRTRVGTFAHVDIYEFIWTRLLRSDLTKWFSAFMQPWQIMYLNMRFFRLIWKKTIIKDWKEIILGFLYFLNMAILYPFSLIIFFFPACHSNHVAMFDYYPYFSTRNMFYPHLKPFFARVSFTWHNLNSSCPQGYHS